MHCQGAATPQMPARRRAPQGGRHFLMQYAIKVIIKIFRKGAGRKM
jgi:hypothetical protein